MSLIVALAVAVIAVSLYLLMVSIGNNRKEKDNRRLLSQFNRLGTMHGISFSGQELLKNAIIGLDGMQRKLLVLKKRSRHSAVSKLIDLANLKQCTVVEDYGIPVDPKGIKPVRISLRFELNDRTREEIIFYDRSADQEWDAPLLASKAKHWEIILNKMLASEKKTA